MGQAADARTKWNRRHRELAIDPLNDPPAEWLIENGELIAALPEGARALDVACGGGRNAMHLARMGMRVDAVDVSDHAIDTLSEAALAEDLSITARRIDLEREALPAGPYDLIVVINYLQRELFGEIKRALAPGGLLLAETDVSGEGVPARISERFTLEPGEMHAACAGLEILASAEGWAERGSGQRHVASIAARAPVSKSRP